MSGDPTRTERRNRGHATIRQRGPRYSTFRSALTCVIAALLVTGLTLPAYASGNPDLEGLAEELQEMGLFRGTETGFELKRQPTRTEAVVMLVRLLGKETEVLSAAPDSSGHPFTDVSAWADPYISYAYRNRLTNGISEVEFGAEEPVTAAQYFTFILRSLGYSDAEGDFAWSASVEKATDLGIETQMNYLQAGGDFLRGNLVDISYAALSAKVKGGETTLLEQLIADGAVQPVPPGHRMARSEESKIILPLDVHNADTGQCHGYFESLSELLAEACFVECVSFHREYVQGLSLQETYAFVLRDALTPPGPNRHDEFYLSSREEESGYVYYYFVLDEDLGLLAYSTSDRFSFEGEQAELVLETRIGFDSHAFIDTLLDQAVALSSDAYRFPSSLLYRDTWQLTYADEEEGEGESEGGESEEDPDDDSPLVFDTVRMDRSSLPAHARRFTRYSFRGYMWLTPVALEHGSVQVYSIDDIDISEVLRQERLSYLATPAGERGSYALEYEPRGIVELAKPSNASRFSLLIVLLQDDAGRILAYTCLGADDLARLAGQ